MHTPMRTFGRKRPKAVATGVTIAALGAALLAPAGAAHAQPPADSGTDGDDRRRAQQLFSAPLHLENPLGEKREALKQRAQEQLITGQARPRTHGGSEVVELGEGEFVEVATTGTDKIFTILVEFGETIHPDFGGNPGPEANRIAEPDRSVDNTTIWREDFDRKYYEDVYYSEDPDVPSVKQYFESQSSGRYSVDGRVTDWVKVGYNEARYGNTACGSLVCPSVWHAVSDGVTAWYEQQLKDGATPEETAASLAEFDVQDRYDHDGDGDFNEPDGYLDHFQIVHAGEDASAGGGAQGDNAIWAHRWYAFGDSSGSSGPEFNPLGGTEIGDTGLWVGDYTMQPENGSVGVFAHEFAHDLGLPDLYDTGGGENGTGFWSSMSSGSWLGPGEDSIGDLPNDMGPWEKLQLGWLDYETAEAASFSAHRLGASAGTYPEDRRRGRTAQGLVVVLPDKTVTTGITEPAQGEAQWWSGMGDGLNNTLGRTVDLSGAGSASLDLTGFWRIEQNYDYLYTEVSTDGGESWTALDGTMSGGPIPRDGSDRPALHGHSLGHMDLSYPLDDYAGRTVELRFRYATDGAVQELGFVADEITVTADGQTVFADDAESGAGDWRTGGFSVVGASVTDDYPQYYVVENRQYTGFDRTLEKGPYNFGFLDERPDWVEHFSYETGMLVWLWDTSQSDNNTGTHPGEGLILPVDAHPEAEFWADGTPARNRIQTRDATFGRHRTPSLTLHKDSVPTKFDGDRGVRAFDDRRDTYWDPDNPMGSVQVPDTNTRITVLTEPRHAGRPMTVLVSPSDW